MYQNKLSTTKLQVLYTLSQSLRYISYSLFFIYVTPSISAQDNLLRALFTFYMIGTNLQ